MNILCARPRLIGLVCGAAAVAMGMAYLQLAGAPPRYLLVNFAALVLGATAWLALGRAGGERLSRAGVATLALSAPLLVTALFGVVVDGASRWVNIGPLGVQVSLIVLPVMILLYARRPDAIGTAGMVVAAAALAIQPDRAMAGVLLASLAALLVAAPGRLALLAAAAATLAFGWTLLVPDNLPASPFVDRVFHTAFDVHALAGTAVLVGAAALLVPAILGGLSGGAGRPAILAFGACWAAVLLAAVLDNYPTPLVGYGGSAVLGYLLSVALLPDAGRRTGAAGAGDSAVPVQPGSDQGIAELRAAGAA